MLTDELFISGFNDPEGQNLAAINQALTQAGQQYADIESANTRLFAR